MNKFKHDGKCIALSKTGLQYSVRANLLSNGMATVIPLSAVRQVEVQEYKGSSKPAFIVVHLRGCEDKISDSSGFEYSVFFNSIEKNVSALEFKQLVDIELARFVGRDSKARGQVVKRELEAPALLNFWRLAVFLFVMLFVIGILQIVSDEDESSSVISGGGGSRGGVRASLEDDAYALISGAPQAKLSLISVKKTLTSPLSYHVKFNTENKNILTKSVGEMGVGATKLFNLKVTDMWNKTYCRARTMKVKQRYGIEILTASINHNNERHSTAICN